MLRSLAPLTAAEVPAVPRVRGADVRGGTECAPRERRYRCSAADGAGGRARPVDRVGARPAGRDVPRPAALPHGRAGAVSRGWTHGREGASTSNVVVFGGLIADDSCDAWAGSAPWRGPSATRSCRMCDAMCTGSHLACQDPAARRGRPAVRHVAGRERRAPAARCSAPADRLVYAAPGSAPRPWPTGPQHVPYRVGSVPFSARCTITQGPGQGRAAEWGAGTHEPRKGSAAAAVDAR